MSRIKLFGNNRTRPRYLERAGGESRYYRDAGEEEDYARSPLKPITIVLAVLAILEALYFVAVYSNIPMAGHRLYPFARHQRGDGRRG